MTSERLKTIMALLMLILFGLSLVLGLLIVIKWGAAPATKATSQDSFDSMAPWGCARVLHYYHYYQVMPAALQGEVARQLDHYRPHWRAIVEKCGGGA